MGLLNLKKIITVLALSVCSFASIAQTQLPNVDLNSSATDPVEGEFDLEITPWTISEGEGANGEKIIVRIYKAKVIHSTQSYDVVLFRTDDDEIESRFISSLKDGTKDLAESFIMSNMEIITNKAIVDKAKKILKIK